MVTVVCTGGEFPPSSLSLAWLDTCQRTIAADGGLAFLRKLNRKADLWVGDGDSLEGPLASWRLWYGEARLLDRLKDDSDTEAAVQIAVQDGAHEVWLLGGAGGRMDHWWANLRMIEGQPRISRWLTGQEQAFILGEGQTMTMEPGTVSVFPLGHGPWDLVSSGFRWPLEAVDFRVWHSLSNECQSEGGTLTSREGRFMVLRPWATEGLG